MIKKRCVKLKIRIHTHVEYKFLKKIGGDRAWVDFSGHSLEWLF